MTMLGVTRNILGKVKSYFYVVQKKQNGVDVKEEMEVIKSKPIKKDKWENNDE